MTTMHRFLIFTTAPEAYDYGTTRDLGRVGNLDRQPVRLVRIAREDHAQGRHLAAYQAERYQSGLYPVWFDLDDLLEAPGAQIDRGRARALVADLWQTVGVEPDEIEPGAIVREWPQRGQISAYRQRITAKAVRHEVEVFFPGAGERGERVQFTLRQNGSWVRRGTPTSSGNGILEFLC